MTTIALTAAPAMPARLTRPSVEDWVLTEFQPMAPIPAAMASCLPAAIEAADSQLAPAPATAVMPLVKDLLAYARAFGIQVEAPAITVITRSYAEALSHLPADLLVEAFRRGRASHRWGNRLPLPAELAATVKDELSRRRLIALRLRTALRAPIETEWRDEPRAPEDIAAVEAAIAGIRAGAGRGDDGSPLAPHPSPLPGSDVVPPEGLTGEDLAAWWRAQMGGEAAGEQAA